MDQLRAMCEELEKRGVVGSGEPVLLAGDFNERTSGDAETRIGASHVSCSHNCRTHASGNFDHFYVRGSDDFQNRVKPFHGVQLSRVSNPSDHMPIMVHVDL